MIKKSKEILCTYCLGKNIIPICYGLPTLEAFDSAKVGKILLGGCVPQKENWWCKDCQKEFYYEEVNK